MDITQAFEVLEKYGLKEKADREIKRLKIAEAPFDMKGHYKVYCRMLSEQRREYSKLYQEYILNSLNSKNKSEPECEELERKLKELSDAEKALEDEAKYDGCNR